MAPFDSVTARLILLLAETGQRVELATVVEDAYQEALANERDPGVREVLAGWTSVMDVVGLTGSDRAADGSTAAGVPTGSGEVR